MSLEKVSQKILCLIMPIVMLLCTSGYTQTFNMPVRHTTPYGSFTTNQRVGIPMYYNNSTIANGKHLYTIVLVNDSTINKKVKIDVSDTVHQLHWKENADKKVIVPRDTKEIFRIDATTGRKISGIPMDSCWAFLVDTKKIRTYSITSEILDPLIAYIQKDEYSPILPLTKDNLELMVSDNEKALALAKKGKLLRALRKYNQE